MTATDTSGENRRRGWLAVLARAGTAELEQLARRCGPWPPAEPVRPPETGMVMLRGRVGGTGNPFNFGEATVTRCAMRVGGRLGVGYTLGRDRRKAELIATIDALLQQPSRCAGLFAEVEALGRAQQAGREAASAEAAASKVEFFTLVRGDA